MPFSEEGTTTPKNSANFYEQNIVARLKTVETDIDSVDLNKVGYKNLAEFFKNNPNKDGKIRQISILKSRWESKLQLKVEESILKLENAGLKKDMLEAKGDCDYFCKLLTGAEIETRKKEVELAWEKSKSNHKHAEEKMMLLLDEMKTHRTIDVDNIRPLLDYLLTESNENILK